MTARSRRLFLLLVLAQAAHSVEEYAFALYDRLPVARVVSGLVSSDLRMGFAVVNASFVAVGLWCWAVPVRAGWAAASVIAWIWVVVEIGNGVGHPAFALAARGYFPGVATAPILLGLALLLAASLTRKETSC
jgi:hypothetical protein